jgi:C1A family cysteine protease
MAKSKESTRLPESYDLRDPDGSGDRSDSLVTPAKDQESCNACWAFAANGGIEGVLKSRFGYVGDFSENNMMYATGYDWGECGGGNADMVMAYFSRNTGPVTEVSDPFVERSGRYCSDCPPIRYVDSMVKLPVRSSVTDNRYIKEALLDYGPLYVAMNWVDGAYNSKTHTYLCDVPGANHSVVLVGWDDQKRVSGAMRPGVFIVKNSWGPDFGEDGFFYVSYDDMGFAFSTLMAFRDVPDSLLPFDRIYYHDRLGMTSTAGYGGHIAWGANVYTAQNDGVLVAVGLFTTAYMTRYSVTVYGKMEGNRFSDVRSYPFDGVLVGAGYHTIKLDEPVLLADGRDFIVAVKFETPDSLWPVPIERPFPDYSSQADSRPGESYLSTDGKSWMDINALFPQSSVCIKALVRERTCSDTEIRVTALDGSDNFVVNGVDGVKVAAVVATECGDPVGDTDVYASFANVLSDITLYDDGGHGDGAGEDGIFAGAIDGPFEGTSTGVSVTAKKGKISITATTPSGNDTNASENGVKGGCFLESLCEG